MSTGCWTSWRTRGVLPRAGIDAMPADAAHVAEAPVVETARLRLRAHGNGCASSAVARMGAPRRLHPDLTISHQAYDKTDALRDINLVFPIERLRELEAECVIGRLAEEHYGFSLMGSAKRLMPSIKEVARRIRESGVDLALLVPA